MIEHNDITWIERTGYPSYAQPEDIYCEECGKNITDEDIYDDATHQYMCRECLLYMHLKE